MSTAGSPVSLPFSAQVPRAAARRNAAAPWYLWVGVLAVTSASVGGAWDFSWHRSIGRDSFWTPAHMCIYACGALAGLLCAWFILNCTFNPKSKLRAASVSVFGLHAPLGIFLAGWGGVAVLTSAPFDNWWHNAYGLDVKIVSPPHALLILGLRVISFGILFLILAAMNRAAVAGAANFKTLQFLFLYIGGLSIHGQMFFLQEFTWDTRLHLVLPYLAMSIGLPVLFATFSQASRYRWAATTTAAIYTIAILLEILIFPLFPAQPKLGPVFTPVTHLIPAKFPILILFPAIALDLLWQRVRHWPLWLTAFVSGILFTSVLVAVEWPFADFLMSHYSQNRFFGTLYFDYFSRPAGLDRLRQFVTPDHGVALYHGLLRACSFAAISTWVGLLFGRWMRGVQR